MDSIFVRLRDKRDREFLVDLFQEILSPLEIYCKRGCPDRLRSEIEKRSLKLSMDFEEYLTEITHLLVLHTEPRCDVSGSMRAMLKGDRDIRLNSIRAALKLISLGDVGHLHGHPMLKNAIGHC